MGGMTSSAAVRQLRLFFLFAAVATAGAILVSAPIRGQEQNVATPADTIMARKTVMDTLSDKMDAIELMISSNKIDFKIGQDNANDISVYLMAFPLLFPPATNQWKPNVTHDPIADTFAAPEVWTKFADFYRQSTAGLRAFATLIHPQDGFFRLQIVILGDFFDNSRYDGVRVHGKIALEKRSWALNCDPEAFLREISICQLQKRKSGNGGTSLRTRFGVYTQI